MDSDPLEKRVESLEDDVYQLNSTVERLEISVGSAITGEQLEKATSDLKSELIWKFVMWNAIIIFGVIAVIVGVVAVLSNLGLLKIPSAS
ncbi:MAG: hypothetical protein OXR67_00710 [Chloroflexota bacterium]|nr:hypothetical protein [Chloroflexota bacterium]